jgi:hypothetical protein
LGWLLWLTLATTAPGSGYATPAAPTARACRYECTCFRMDGYRCQRWYSETCDRRACWECQDALTVRARLSCSLGGPVRDCFCKGSAAPVRSLAPAQRGRCRLISRRSVPASTVPRQTLRM